MKFYYQAKHLIPYEEDCVFLCTFECELKKDDCIVIDLGIDVGIVTAFIIRRIEELTALTSQEEIFEALEYVDLTAYRKAKQAEAQANILLRKMQDRMSNVKMIESIRKTSSLDPEMAELFATFQKLNKVTASTDTETPDTNYVSD